MSFKQRYEYNFCETKYCAKEITPETNETPEVNPNLVDITLTSTGESDEETKAVFSGYPKIAWEGNEEISLLGTNTGNQKLTAGSSDNIHRICRCD